MRRIELSHTSRLVGFVVLASLAIGCGGPKTSPWHNYSAADLGLAASFPNPFDAADEAVPSKEAGATRYVTVRGRGNGPSLMFLITCAVYPEAIAAGQASAAHDNVVTETESFAASVSRKDRTNSNGIVGLKLNFASNSAVNSRVEDIWTGNRHIVVVAEGDSTEINSPDVDRFFQSIKITPPISK
ncbi:MAG: hypothetical protein K2Y37_16795 [Pirellulales bacterium]|nr:hypothetical protein [Pirellulales bacterium]